LVDGAALQAIVAAAAVAADDTVLEVGPGLGVLTRELAARAGRVVSVELDGRLLPVLGETLADLDNVTLIHGDGLTFDLSALPEESLLVANLPYNVGTPILVRALESGRFKRLVFLVQREVAQRLAAAPGTPAYGALSLIVAHGFGAAETVREVKPSAFAPPPEVTSSVVRLDVRSGAESEPALFKLVHQAFAHRRKTLKKNLLMAGYGAPEVEAALIDLGLDPRVRAETLGIAAFYELRRCLQAH
jgi:16S rRNA (adenine1518-N6/adenine1519-N6)-dimethyltransferase